MDNTTSVIRPDSGVTTNLFDNMNRMTSTTDPKSQTTTMGYDSADNLTSLTDANSHAYQFSYDLMNRRTSMTYPDSSHEDYTYDAVGNLAAHTARAGQVRTYTYDSRDRETVCNWNDSTPDVTKTYDDASRITQLSSSISTLSYSYDNANQLSSESQNIAGSSGGTKTISYTYDADGNRATLTYPDGTTVTNGFTGRNQLASITADAPPPLATYTYDLNGNRTAKSLENNTSATYSFDDANRLTSLVHKQGTTTFASFAYGYDTVNRRTYVKREDNKGDVYRYDPTDQTTNVLYNASNPDTSPSSPQRTMGYSYDSVGNRTQAAENTTNTTSYTANNLNQYTAVGGTNVSYDGNGNLIAQNGWGYSYDAQNRLLSATNGVISASFAYDAINRCVSRTVNSTNTFFYYYDWSLIEERNSSDSELAHYIHGAAVDEILVKVNGGAVYYHHDGLGNVTYLTDATDAVIEQYTYDIFGAATIRDGGGAVISATAYGNRFLFNGREYLGDVTLYDYRNRLYSQQLGRFLQTDPIKFQANDVNLYRYVRNNPVNRVDLDGLKEDPMGKEAPEYGKQGNCLSYVFREDFPTGEGPGIGPDVGRRPDIGISFQDMFAAVVKILAEKGCHLKSGSCGAKEKEVAILTYETETGQAAYHALRKGCGSDVWSHRAGPKQPDYIGPPDIKNLTGIPKGATFHYYCCPCKGT